VSAGVVTSRQTTEEDEGVTADDIREAQMGMERQAAEMRDYMGLFPILAKAMGADDRTAEEMGGDYVVGFNARETTDEVVAAFDRLERAVQIARAVYQENPSHAPARAVPVHGTMCAMMAISHAVSHVPR
jgi:hypothetical protein